MEELECFRWRVTHREDADGCSCPRWSVSVAELGVMGMDSFVVDGVVETCVSRASVGGERTVGAPCYQASGRRAGTAGFND